jgi:hypothetical protein
MNAVRAQKLPQSQDRALVGSPLVLHISRVWLRQQDDQFSDTLC